MDALAETSPVDPADESGAPWLTASDTLLILGAGFAAMLLLGPGRWAPGAWTSGVFFLSVAGGLAALRFLGHRPGASPLWGQVADFWLLPCVALGHTRLDPLVKAFQPVLRDPLLASLEQRFLGGHATLTLEGVLPGALLDLLLVCYYSYFILPLALGVLLYRTRRVAYARYVLALTLFYALNFTLYVLVPAVGPRFYLAPLYAAPLEGGLLTPWLDGWMRLSPFLMDCFPSGHTGVTLVMLLFAARYQRKFLRAGLPLGLGLIAATILGRFHYGIDLIAAVPVALGCVALSRVGERRRVRGIFPFRRPVPSAARA